jgi:hypothetical protein
MSGSFRTPNEGAALPFLQSNAARLRAARTFSSAPRGENMKPALPAVKAVPATVMALSMT